MSGHLISRAARAHTCPACGSPVLIAVTGGITIIVTPQPLSIAGEITALLSGRRTYDILVHGIPRLLFLEWRDTSRIRSRKHMVVASHPCRTTATPADGTEIRIPFTASPLPDIPPF